MPKPLAESFQKIFSSYIQQTSSFSVTAFEIDEIKGIQAIFEEAATYEIAYRQLEQQATVKNINKNHDPFLIAMEEAYEAQINGNSNHQIAFKSLLSPETNDPVELKASVSETFDIPKEILETDDSSLRKKMAAKKFFCCLLEQFNQAEPEDNDLLKLGKGKKEQLSKQLKNYLEQDNDISVWLIQMINVVFQRKLTDKLTNKSPEFALISNLLLGFLLLDKLTNGEFSFLIHNLVSVFTVNGTKSSSWEEDQLINDLFVLRLTTLNTLEEKKECRAFFSEIKKSDRADIPCMLQYLCSTFVTINNQTDFEAYQMFMQNIASALAVCRDSPLEENSQLVRSLLEQGTIFSMVINQEGAPPGYYWRDKFKLSEKWLNALRTIYRKSSLISEQQFIGTTKRLLLQLAKFIPPMQKVVLINGLDSKVLQNLDDIEGIANNRKWLIHDFINIYQRYAELKEEDKALASSFLLDFCKIVEEKELLKTDYLRECEVCLPTLIKHINVNNYPFVSKCIDVFYRDYSVDTLKILFSEKKSEISCENAELLNDIIGENSPFLRRLVDLYDCSGCFQTNPEIWIAIRSEISNLIRNGEMKEAVATLLRYSLANYGLIENISSSLEHFRVRVAWLFMLLHDPNNEEDKILVLNIKNKRYDSINPLSMNAFPIHFSVLRALGVILGHYRITFNAEVVEKFLKKMMNTAEAGMTIGRGIFGLPPVFFENPDLFRIVVKIFYEFRFEALGLPLNLFVIGHDVWDYFIDRFIKIFSECSTLAQYAKGVHYVFVDNRNEKEIQKKFILNTLPVIAKKFTNNYQDCFSLLQLIDKPIALLIGFASELEKFVQQHYAQVVEKYLAHLENAFKEPISEIVLTQSKVLGGAYAETAENYLGMYAAKKSVISLEIENNREKLLQLESYSTLKEWFSWLEEKSEKIKNFEKEAGDMFLKLPVEIMADIDNLCKNIVHEKAFIHEMKDALMKRYYALKNNPAYETLAAFQENSARKGLLETELKTYFNSVNSLFRQLDLFFEKLQHPVLDVFVEKPIQLHSDLAKKILDEENFTEENLKLTIITHLQNRSLVEQKEAVWELKKDFEEIKKQVNGQAGVIPQLEEEIQTTTAFFSHENRKIYDQLAASLEKINNNFWRVVRQEISDKEKEKINLESQIGLLQAEIQDKKAQIKKLDNQITKRIGDLRKKRLYLEAFPKMSLHQIETDLRQKTDELKKRLQAILKFLEKGEKCYEQKMSEMKGSFWFIVAEWIWNRRDTGLYYFIPVKWAENYLNTLNTILPNKINALNNTKVKVNRLLVAKNKLEKSCKFSKQAIRLRDVLNELKGLTSSEEENQANKALDYLLLFSSDSNFVLKARDKAHGEMKDDYDKHKQAYTAFISTETQKIIPLKAEIETLSKTSAAQQAQLNQLISTLLTLTQKSAELNQERELLIVPYQKLSTYFEREGSTPLMTLLSDEMLWKYHSQTRLQKLKALIAEENPENYRYIGTRGPIHDAVENETPEILQIILNGMQKFSVDTKNKLLNTPEVILRECDQEKIKLMLTPLHIAIMQHDFAKIKLLVEAGCDLNTPAIHVNQVTGEEIEMPPILFLYSLAEIQMTIYLMNVSENGVGADINAVDGCGDTLLHKVIKKGDLPMMYELLKQPDIQIEIENNQGQTPLIIAAELSGVPDASRYPMIAALVKDGKTVTSERFLNTQCMPLDKFVLDENGNTFLHQAIIHKDLAVVVWLTRQSYFRKMLNAPGAWGSTPLELAAFIGDLSIFKALWYLEGYDIDVNKVNEKGEGVLYCALSHYPQSQAVIDFILNDKKLNIQALRKNGGYLNILSVASESGNNFYLHKLINLGIDPNWIDSNDWNLLHYAAWKGHISTVKFLVEMKTVSSLHPQDNHKKTPLMCLYENQKLPKKVKAELVEYFIEKTIDVTELFHKRNESKMNILDLAVKADDLVTVAQLIKKTKKALAGMAGVGIIFKEGAKDFFGLNDDNFLIKAFYLATSSNMVEHFVKHRLIDIDDEAEPFIEKLLHNKHILDREKRKMIRFISKNTQNTANTKTPEAWAPSLFQGQQVVEEEPMQFNLCEIDEKIVPLVSKLCFELPNDCQKMITILKQAKDIQKSSGSLRDWVHYNVLWSLKDTKGLTIAQSVINQFANVNSTHPSFEYYLDLLIQFLRLSDIKACNSSKQCLLLTHCKGVVKTVFREAQMGNTDYQIEKHIEKMLTLKENNCSELNQFLNELYLIRDYKKQFENKEQSLLIDEQQLEDEALRKAKLENLYIHIGYVIEAFQLASLTQLYGAESQFSLFEYGRLSYAENPDKTSKDAQRSRMFYIDVVKTFLSVVGVKVDLQPASFANAVTVIPAPLQSSSNAPIPVTTAAPYSPVFSCE